MKKITKNSWLIYDDGPHPVKGCTVADGFLADEINQLIDEVEALKKSTRNRLNIVEKSLIRGEFCKPADDKPEKVTLHDIVANTPEGSAAVDRALERSAERQNEMKRKAEEMRDTEEIIEKLDKATLRPNLVDDIPDTHRTDKPFLCSSCKMTVLGLNPDDTMCSSCKAKDKPDTHRTVTLRIPKGMTIGEAISEAFKDSDYYVYIGDLDDNILQDTDLQKALDEVEHE